MALLNGFPSFGSAIIKFLFYSVSKNKFKKNIYLHRILGSLNASLGKKSFYRPKIND